MTQSREAAKQRTSILKQVRDQHPETVERTRELLKSHKAIRSKICQQMRHGSETVPEIAAATGLDAHEVLWHITAMKKYGVVAETGQCGEYYRYAMVKDLES